MDEREHGHNMRGLELLCDIVRGQAASLRCPDCGHTLNDVQIELADVTIDHVALDVICRSCQRRFPVTVAPASDGGVAVVQ